MCVCVQGGGGVGGVIYPLTDRQADRHAGRQEYSCVDAGPSAGQS